MKEPMLVRIAFHAFLLSHIPLFYHKVMGAAALCVKLYSLINHVQLLYEHLFVFFSCRELMGVAW